MIKRMKHKVQVIPANQILEVDDGYNLGKALRACGYKPDMYCGGRGTCEKCKVNADGHEVLACQYTVKKDMVVHLNHITDMQILEGWNYESLSTDLPCGYFVAIDIGTTTIVGHLFNAAGKELAFASILNPQRKYGAVVVTRIQAALEGSEEALVKLLREGIHQILHQVCKKASVFMEEIMRISLVRNPCMQQFFFAVSVKNLTQIPFIPEIRKFQTIPASVIFPDFASAEIYMVPDISGYEGADTIGCVISSRMYQQESMTLLIDIGTNGEMVLGNKDYMVSCSTAAGPTLEGANIQFGMNGRVGAIDYVSLENGEFHVHVIGKWKKLDLPS